MYSLNTLFTANSFGALFTLSSSSVSFFFLLQFEQTMIFNINYFVYLGLGTCGRFIEIRLIVISVNRYLSVQSRRSLVQSISSKNHNYNDVQNAMSMQRSHFYFNYTSFLSKPGCSHVLTPNETHSMCRRRLH